MLKPMLIEGRPHWEVRFPEDIWPAYEDFRNFLWLVWDHLGLPEPTPAQYEVAHRLQYGADTVEWETLTDDEKLALLTKPREDIIRAFRSLGKSYVTVAFVVWRLMRNPRDEKILILSAAGTKAKEFVDQAKGLLESMPMIKWLLEGTRENGTRRRDQSDRFDVAFGSNTQSTSVTARGITGQITGSRATCIVADDIEVPDNSLTEEARKRIIDKIRNDFGPIRKTEHGLGDAIFLGTPQTEESVYNVLVIEMQFSCFTIPVRFPTADKLANYILTEQETGREINILAYYLRAAYEDDRLDPWGITDTRFSEDELLRLEGQGRVKFALQYMLDTSLSDAERYPLKQHDLIVFSTHHSQAPLLIQWGHHNDRRNVISDIPNLGFSGDHFLRPLKVSEDDWRPYASIVMFVDPSGRGADETAWAIVAELAGTFFVLHVGGMSGDPDTAMRQIAIDAKKWQVELVEIEPNYGQGVWIEAFKPVLSKLWPKYTCGVRESEWAKGQKETRIIGTLEPAMAAHRIVMNEAIVREEARKKDAAYSLMYQLTHITHERKSIKHDDRLDALAGAIAYYTRMLSQDVEKAGQSIRDQEFLEELEDFAEMHAQGFPIGRRSGRMRGKRRADGLRNDVFSFTL